MYDEYRTLQCELGLPYHIFKGICPSQIQKSGKLKNLNVDIVNKFSKPITGTLLYLCLKIEPRNHGIGFAVLKWLKFAY